jgi:hypothetical protein
MFVSRSVPRHIIVEVSFIVAQSRMSKEVVVVFVIIMENSAFVVARLSLFVTRKLSHAKRFVLVERNVSKSVQLFV